MSINPRPLIVESNRRVIGAFEAIYKETVNELGKTLSYKYNPEFSVVSLYLIYKYLDSQFGKLDEELESVVDKQLEVLYYLGYGLCLMAFYDTIGRSYTVKSILAEVPRIPNRDILVNIRKTTMTDLLQVTKNTNYAVKQMVRRTFDKHMTVRNMLKTDRKDLANMLIKDITGKKLKQDIKDSMIAIVDKAGRRWKVEHYVSVVTKTKAQEVVVKGIKRYVDTHDGKGDLARIPFNPLTDDPCLNYQGLIISMTGATAGFRTYDELKATRQIFHPQCRHTPIPYYDIDSFSAEELEKHKKMEKRAEKDLQGL
ncbi:hypothetical protein vBCtySFA70_00004 [Clostridium phage vB_CtyS-FA70]|nr:hypothetical protein vBCtySFA70_00004 [Clostridium phage vB_CtyS-FA70]